jgi:periplasmic protein TonB
MRTYTLACSIVGHVLIVSGFIIAPIVATDELPEPRRAFDFIIVRPLLLPEVPTAPPAGKPQPTAGSFNRDAAPLTAPDTIAPDSGIDPFESRGIPEGVPYGLPAGPEGGLGSDVVAPPPPPPPPPVDRAPIRVGGSIKEPQKIRHVAPAYNAIAQAAGVQGTVILEAVIGEDGRVRNVRVLRPVALLDHSAIDAVRQWQFTPTLLNGEPVPVVMTVTVTFTLRR